MTPVQKIIAGVLIGLLWLGALVAKHFFADIPIDAFTAFCIAALSGLGIHAASTGSADKQAGFVSYPMLWMAAVLSVAVCFAGCAAPPTPGQQTQIRMACAADAGIRPSVDVLRAIPGFATPAEETAILTARSIIDPICANPAGPFTVADPYVAVTQASATVAGVLVQMEARKAGK
jgi:hypothetical protein